MSEVEFIDQTLRDGQQSLWGLRMRAFQAGPALEHLDRTGFRVVDLTGAGMMEVLTRSFHDDPWASTDVLIAGLRHSVTRAAVRTISVVGMGFAPDSIIDLWITTYVKHGIRSFWTFDCLYDMPQMRRTVKTIVDAGAAPAPAIMYGLTDVHTDEFFADRAREMASWEGVGTIYVEDAPGVLTPERARTLLPALQAATPDVPLELHAHNTTGLAPLVYIEGLGAGITILHTASRPMANGPSLPSTEGMLETLSVLGHTHRLDTSRLEPVAEHFRREAQASGYDTGVPNEFSLLPYRHQLPGGMTGTLKAQLAQHGMEHRLREVLEETMVVREELGQPIMATPFSQFIGIQAVLNVVTGERYSVVPTEVIQYALGHYGPLMRPVDPPVMDRITSQPRAGELQGWERPQPSLREIRNRLGRTIPDEELLLRFHLASDEVDAMIAARPIRTDPRTAASEIVEHVADLVAESRSLRSIAISRPELSIRVRRHEPAALTTPSGGS